MCCYGNFRENQPTILLNKNSAQPHKSAGATTVWNKVQQTQKYLYFFVNMKHARKNILIRTSFKTQETISNFDIKLYPTISHASNNNRLYCYQILTIIAFIPDKHAKTLFLDLFYKEHSFRNAENNNKKARKLGQIKTLLF